LMRFENYRKSTGKPLPTREEALSEHRRESADIFN
jgi:hypothetical protein